MPQGWPGQTLGRIPGPDPLTYLRAKNTGVDKNPLPTFRDANEARVSNMVVTVKRRFKQLLERYVSKFVDSNEDVSLEIRRLLNLFSQGST